MYTTLQQQQQHLSLSAEANNVFVSDMQSVAQLSPSGSISSGRQQTDGQGGLRLRVCDNCRIKKIKCDMKKPPCTACSRRDVTCKYSRHRMKPGPPKQLVNKAATVIGSPKQIDCGRNQVVDSSAFMLDSDSTGAEQYQNSCFLTDNASWSDNLSGSEILGANATLPTLDIPVTTLSRHLSSHSVGGEAHTFSDPSPEMEEFLLKLYVQHVQPIYPFLRVSASSTSKYEVCGTSIRLRMSIYAVASRYASLHQHDWFFSPDYFAMRAEHHFDATNLSIDELKASILLCLHRIASTITWDAVAEMARITRMAELYHRLIATRDKKESSSWSMCDEEELRTVWWCIYSLDTCFSAVAVISHAMVDPALGKMTLPNTPVPNLTNSTSPAQGKLDHLGETELSLTRDLKLWETMTVVFSRSSCRGRSLHIGACKLMRSVTDLRLSASQGCGPAWKARFQELESDCAATTLSLPVWVFNPSRDFGTGETERDHRDRLETLIVWQGACLLHATLAVQLDDSDEMSLESILRARWQTIVARANEVLRVAQNWKPDYFEAIDSKCAYIILFTGIVLSLDCFLAGTESCNVRPSHHVDLIFLFLDQIGRYWPLANHSADVLKSLWAKPLTCQSYKSVCEFLSRIVLKGQIRFSTISEANDGGCPCSIDLLSLSSVTAELEDGFQNQRGSECWTGNQPDVSWNSSDPAVREVDLSLNWDSVLLQPTGPDQY